MSGRNFYDDGSMESSDSDSDSDYREVLYSSSSIDRSSIGSIPWAEDAIKQNQLDWERIERMFYNEEDLPNDPELRNEIIDWQKRFPHLRIIGKKIENTSVENDNKQLDWPVSERLKPEDNNINKFSAKSLKPLSTKTGVTKDNHNNLFGFSEDLRISSVSIVARKNNGINQKQNPRYSGRFINFGLQNPSSPSKSSRFYIPSKTESLLLATRPKEKYDISIAKLSNSASFVRMPPITNTIKQRNVYLEPMEYVLTASSPTTRSINVNHRFYQSEENRNATRSGVNRNTVILPSLDMDQLNLNSLPIVRTNKTTNQIGRSISAAFNHRQLNNSYIPISASNLKISK